MSAAKSNTLRRLVRRWWGAITGKRLMRYSQLVTLRSERNLSALEDNCERWIERLPHGYERRQWITLLWRVRMARTRCAPNASGQPRLAQGDKP